MKSAQVRAWLERELARHLRRAHEAQARRDAGRGRDLNETHADRLAAFLANRTTRHRKRSKAFRQAKDRELRLQREAIPVKARKDQRRKEQGGRDMGMPDKPKPAGWRDRKRTSRKIAKLSRRANR